MLLRGELQRFAAKFEGFQNTMMEELRKLQMSCNQREEIVTEIRNEVVANVKQEFAQEVENMCKRRCEEEISNKLEEEKRRKNLGNYLQCG